jgi:hypothetical protein
MVNPGEVHDSYSSEPFTYLCRHMALCIVIVFHVF